jgi:transcriptional regulator with XRE-family HTH domain
MTRGASRDIAIRKRLFGFYLRRRRLALKLSQKELAVLASTRQSTISRLEACQRVPRPATLERIDGVLKGASPK